VVRTAESNSSSVVATVAAAVAPAAPPAPSLAHVWNYETQRVAIELKRRTIEQLPCADTQLAEAFCAALSFVDGVTTTTRQERSLVVIDVVAHGADGEERCALVFITGLHHSTVVAGLNKSIELAKQGSVVVVREARFPLAETWALVQERSAEFDRMPHTGWLWLTDEDVQQSTALAQLFSQARGRRVRLSDGEAPLSLDEVRARLGELLTPAQWPMVVRIVGERESGTDAGTDTDTATITDTDTDTHQHGATATATDSAMITDGDTAAEMDFDERELMTTAVFSRKAPTTDADALVTTGTFIRPRVDLDNDALTTTGKFTRGPAPQPPATSRSFAAPPLQSPPPAQPPSGWIRQAGSLGLSVAKDAWRKFRRGS
jgi:hypothetical protein